MQPWLKFSSGKYVNIRCSPEMAEKFPDGCHIKAETTAGVLTITLLNRVGPKFFRDDDHRGQNQAHWVGFSRPDYNLPLFGSVAPEEIVEVRGGLQLIMPAVLPALRNTNPNKGKGKPAKPTASQPAPAPTQPQAAPAPAPAAPTQPQGAAPATDLRAAVRAVNEWKQFLGDEMRMEVVTGGVLTVWAQYQ